MKRSARLGWILKMFFVLILAGTVVATVVLGMVFWNFSKDLPELISAEDYRPATVTQVIATGDGKETVIGEFHGGERRYVIPYESIPQVVVDAFTSAEDDLFFEHQGVNPAAILRASIANFREGKVVQGGSTITQQVAKSLLLTPERSFSRKAKELILSQRLERNLTKQQILFLYLNQIYLGHGAYGVQAASRVYFNKDVSEITTAEAALIAGMPQAPGKFSPHLNPRRAKDRQLYVLRRMYENRKITQQEMTESAAQPLRIYSDQDVNQKYAGYLVEHLRRYLLDKYGEKALYSEGLTVRLPTSPTLALAARKSLQEGLREVDKRIGYRGPLKRLTSSKEIESSLQEIRNKIIQKELGFRAFMPDGTLSESDAVRIAGHDSDVEMLKQGSIYEAVVTEVDDKSKMAIVTLGAVRAELPLEGMKWAKKVRDESNSWQPEPKQPSKVVAKGDVVLVQVTQIQGSKVIVALDQEPEVQGALLSLDAATGEVLAMEGGYDYARSEFNRAAQAQRQPGSAYKPIIFSAAMEKGFTPASIIVDSPIVYEDVETGKWKPTNFEEKFYGDTTFRQALIKSRNVPTIKLVQAIGVQNLINFSKRIGFAAQLNQDLSISLGSGATSLLEMTKVYALFPRLGRKVEPQFLAQVLDREGKVLEDHSGTGKVNEKGEHSSIQTARDTAAESGEPESNPEATPGPDGRMPIVFPEYPRPNDPGQVMDPRIAYVMSHLMREVVDFGTGYKAKSLGRPAAGKTGTTNDYLDAWFMGFTPDVVTGVWVGFDNLKSMGPGETGAKAALPIWLNYMKEAVKKYPEKEMTIPPGVVYANIHPGTGKLAAANSSNSIKEAFIEGTEPTERVNSAGISEATSASEFLKEDIE